MKHKVFSIYDSKAEAYNTPFFFPNSGQATRAFSDLCADPNSSISKHPEDYTLFEIGTFDIDTGKIEPLKTPVSLGLGIEYIGEKVQ